MRPTLVRGWPLPSPITRLPSTVTILPSPSSSTVSHRGLTKVAPSAAPTSTYQHHQMPLGPPMHLAPRGQTSRERVSTWLVAYLKTHRSIHDLSPSLYIHCSAPSQLSLPLIFKVDRVGSCMHESPGISFGRSLNLGRRPPHRSNTV
jgi:hypothetical protein